MNVLAEELNEILDKTVAGSFLSVAGRRMFFPKGIVAQSEEAKQKATLYNATAGLATKGGQPIHLSDIMNQFKAGALTPAEVFSYAPGGGDKGLRALWKDEMIKKNPNLKDAKMTMPLVTAGLTHAISMVGTLFCDEGDDLVLPDLFWDNYELIFQDNLGCKITYFPFFKDGGFNSEGMEKALMSAGENVRILLNFPNNPTGYTPSSKEMKEIVATLIRVADTGKKILVISDDAYYGLFYEPETERQSLFSYLASAHKNIFAVKGDAATKEDMVWGFRIGFLTYASKDFDEVALDALTKKTLGMIRCSVSNCDRPGQSLLMHAWKEGKRYEEDKQALFDEMEKRYRILKSALVQYEDKYELLCPMPFNSGYFMAFETKRNPEELRTYMLDKYGVGIINIMNRTLRVAYCSVEADAIADLVKLLYKAAGEIWS